MKTERTGLMERVVASVTRRGACTVDDLVAEFPESTKKQLHAALCNARDARRLRIKARGTHKQASVWEAGAHHSPVSRRSRHAQERQPIASVWELGTPRAISMPPQRGRIFNLLGGWTD
jgi:hypothetical protein